MSFAAQGQTNDGVLRIEGKMLQLLLPI